MIEIHGLAKSFVSGRGANRRTVMAVRNATLVARNGSITGLLGPNGAGKTTTLRMVATLVQPDAGEALVDGASVSRQPMEARAHMGVLSDARGLYTRMTARENIRYYGRLRGMADADISTATEHLAGLIDMTELLGRRTDGFSQGERMKVAIARAMVHDPQNLILDEPTNGLDIMSTRALREVLRSLRDAGKCILMSSHIMQEISALADQIVVMAGGATIATGNSEELIALSHTSNLEDAFVALTQHTSDHGKLGPKGTP
jgi:sodium transport system ATP-binding protein